MPSRSHAAVKQHVADSNTAGIGLNTENVSAKKYDCIENEKRLFTHPSVSDCKDSAE